MSTSHRERYLRYEELTTAVTALAEANPEFVKLERLATSVEGRSVWLLVIGRDRDRLRPAAWVDGNMHACEVAGSSVALAIAEALVAIHRGESVADLPGHLLAFLREESLVYVVPRLSPDGAERQLELGAYVRSNPRDDRFARAVPYFRASDVDGDGQARLMRRQDPAGDFVACPDRPELLLQRRIEDPGPYYSLYPEGFIENWDGFTVPGGGDIHADNSTDLNRNFPYQWQPEPHQSGAGRLPTSEPESRAVAEFAVAHPNLYAWLNLHTFGGCFIRPAGDRIDKKMDPSDLALYRQLGAWAEAFTGYPMVSGFEEFTYEPDKPLNGDLTAFAHGQRGIVAMVCELWDFWKQAGLEVHRPFVQNYSRRTREDALRIAAWDTEKNHGRVVGHWKPFNHPQLGPVEIGGFDPRVGIWNPPYERLSEVCDGQVKMFLRLVAIAPRVRAATSVEAIGEGLSRVQVIAENIGYLPTYVLASSKHLPFNEPLEASIAVGPGLELVSEHGRAAIGHLEGWGDYEGAHTGAFARSSRPLARRRVSFVVRGKGTAEIAITSPRTGRVEAHVEVR